MLRWKETSQGSSALLIDGARRVGKSYISKVFAENEYKSYILIDFANVDQAVLDVFLHDKHDLDLFFAKLSAFFGVILYLNYPQSMTFAQNRPS